MKLSKKLSIVIIIFSIISISFASFLTYTLTKNALQIATEQKQLQLASDTLDKIDRILYERMNGIKIIASDSQIVQYTITSNEMPSLSASTTENAFAFKRAIQQLLLLTGPWDDIVVTNTDGKSIFSTNATIAGNMEKDSTISSLVKQALSGSVVYSDVFKLPNSEKATMVFIAPVHNGTDPSRPITGVTIGYLSWPVILETLQNTNARYLNITNKYGFEIGDSDPQANVRELLRRKYVSDSLLSQENFNSSIIAVSQETNKSSLISYVQEKGYLDYKGNDWLLLVENPTEIAFSQAISSASFITIGLFPIFIVANGLLLIFVLNSLKPLQLIDKRAKEIAAGDFSKRISVHSKDEVGELANTFNDMTDKLQASYSGLKEKVAEKTAELASKVNDLERAKKDMMIVLKDLKEEKDRTEEAKAKDDAILSSIGDGVIATNAVGEIVFINNVAAEMLGWRKEELLNKNIINTMNLQDDKGVAIAIELRPTAIATRENKKINNIYKYFRHDGSTFLAAVSVSPVMVNNKIIGAIEVFRDVTKEKEIDRMKTEFISLASHQLRTPLSAIKWFCEMLIGGDAGQLSKEQKEFAENIYESTERMVELVNSLLNISRIESGRIVIDPRPTDLKELVEGIVKELQAKIQQKQQKVLINVHESLPKINVDPKLIRQVYLNLLTNAIKYTPKDGEIFVFISKNNNEVISQVSDNGYGIPLSEQPKIFRKFFRAHNVVKIETDGTGLGLYLIKAIIESSQGKIWFTSEEGKGTSFFFSIPISGMIPQKGEISLDS